MGRVLVVSRNPGMAMGLSATSHDVVDIRPSAFDAWVGDSHGALLDGVVLDVTDADTALHAITELRAHAQMAPVLVVPGDGPGWDDARMLDLPAAALMPRPVTKPGLQEAVERLLALGAQSFLTSPAPSSIDAGEGDPSGVDDAADEHTDSPQVPLLDAPQLDAPQLDAPQLDAPLLDAPEVDEVAALLDRLTAAPSVVPVPHLDPAGALVPAAPAPEVVSSSSRGSAQPTDPETLVRGLLRIAQDLYGVAETAEVVVLDALERTGAPAGALLLPDGARWRVAAGVGLRPLEYRFELTADDWLVVQVAKSRRSILMEDTDIVRQPLRGSPLASWHHLVATPVPGVDGVLLVAREDEPAFSEGDVEVLARLTTEAAPLIASSLQVRDLARRLAHLRDVGDAQRART